MQTTVNKFFKDIAKNPRWAHFKTEVQKKLNSELQKLKASVGPTTWHTAEKNYNQIIKKLSAAQKQVDLELQKTLKSIKTSASEVEKTLAQYKAIALKQRAQVKKKAVTKKPTPTKKAKKTTSARKKATRA